MTFSSCERNVLGYLGNGHYSAFRGAILSAVHTVLVLSTYMKLGSGQVRKEKPGIQAVARQLHWG